MARRKIGPAYERSPFERLAEWANRNLLILISAVCVSTVFWFCVNWTIDGLMNFLATGGDAAQEKPYSSDDPMWIIVKLVGSLLCMVIVVKSRSK